MSTALQTKGIRYMYMYMYMYMYINMYRIGKINPSLSALSSLFPVVPLGIDRYTQ